MSEAYFAIENQCLKISGELCLKQATVILEQLNSVLQDNQVNKIDFSAIVSCDTTAILILFVIKRTLTNSFELLNVPEKLIALLQLSNLTTIFKVV